MNLPAEVEQQILATPGAVVRKATPFVEVPPDGLLSAPATRVVKAGAKRTPKLVAPSWAVEVVVPVALPNLLNLGGGPLRKKITLPGGQRAAVYQAMQLIAPWLRLYCRWCVTLTRLGGRGFADDEALYASFKHVRDAVAVLIVGGRPGERDDDPRIEWVRQQQPGGPVGVRIRIEVQP